MSDERTRWDSYRAMNRPTSPRSQWSREGTFTHQPRSVVSQPPSTYPSPTASSRSSESIHRFAGVAVGIACSVLSECVFSYQCIVLRRQCLSNSDGSGQVGSRAIR